MIKGSSFIVGGHRGAGCTDSGPANGKPAENTIESFRQAFNDGADFIELDAVETADHKIVVIHADNLSHHVFGANPFNSVGETSLTDLKTLRVGKNRTGEIPTLVETLDFLRTTEAFNRSAFCLNIELKNIREIEKGKFRPKPDSYYDTILSEIAGNGFPLDKIVFSSFAARDLAELKKRAPEAKTGFLFWETDSGASEEIYPGQAVENALYLPFTPENIEAVRRQAAPDYLHPEVKALTAAAVALAAQYGMGLNTWPWLEKPPTVHDPVLVNALTLTARHGMTVSFCTDYVTEMKQLLGQIANPPTP
ncbi:MAG TPA: glycerophosphodiester phosphodiesterase [Alphaproteobacteria bacterium]